MPLAEYDNGAAIWYSDISEIASVTSQEWDAHMGMLTAVERQRVMKYRFDDDRRRALVSALLQNWMVRLKLRVDNNDSFEILRTIENKPFAKMKNKPVNAFGYWNYNLSHHGNYVGIAAHKTRIIGVDIVDLSTRTSMASTAYDYAHIFKSQLHPKELQAILEQPSETAAYTLFFVLWSLKEAFIKAVGLGLGYDLRQLYFTVYYEQDRQPLSPQSFAYGDVHRSDGRVKGYARVLVSGKQRSVHRVGSYVAADVSQDYEEESGAEQEDEGRDAESHPPVASVSASVEGEEEEEGGGEVPQTDCTAESEWTFDFFSLDHRHVVSVAKGPLSESTASYINQAWDKEAPFPSTTQSPVATTVSTDNDDDDISTWSLRSCRSVDMPMPPRSCRLPLHALLTSYQQMLIPAPLPMSPPSTELNNRHDPSVLINNNCDVGMTGTGAGSVVHVVSDANGLQHPRTVQLPMSPSAPQERGEPSPLTVSTGKLATASISSETDILEENDSAMQKGIVVGGSSSQSSGCVSSQAPMSVLMPPKVPVQEDQPGPSSTLTPPPLKALAVSTSASDAAFSGGSDNLPLPIPKQLPSPQSQQQEGSGKQRPFTKLQKNRHEQPAQEDDGHTADWRLLALPHRLRKNSFDAQLMNDEADVDMGDMDAYTPSLLSPGSNSACDLVLDTDAEAATRAGAAAFDFNSPASWRGGPSIRSGNHAVISPGANTPSDDGGDYWGGHVLQKNKSGQVLAAGGDDGDEFGDGSRPAKLMLPSKCACM
jgi:phosphopantetheine--protein transferase-like protein